MAITISGVRRKDRNTVEDVTVSAVKATGSGLAPAPAVSNGGGGGGTITHGDQLTTSVVGPWSLQGVSKGSETLDSPSGPGRGYWRFDTPDEFAPTGTYVYNNSPSNHGGVVPAGGLTIDGYSVPAGVRVVQFRTFPDGYDFYAQGTTLKVLFRGCRFRWNSGVGGPGLFNDNGAPTGQQIMMHYCDVGLNSLDPPDGSQGCMFVKNLGGSGHRYLRNYMTKTAVFLQPNAPDVEVTENWMGENIFPYGEGGTTGTGGSSVFHVNGISTEGGLRNFKALRNRITCASPDGATGSTGSALGQIGYGTQPGQTGYGSGSEPGRLTIQTDNIAIFAITGYNDGVEIKDNYLGGSGVCIYAGNADSNARNIVVTGNKITTRWWTNGGNFGPITDQPTWGANGNSQSNNTWADDYGTGGNGCTAPAGRQYPAGNGPRAGTSII